MKVKASVKKRSEDCKTQGASVCYLQEEPQVQDAPRIKTSKTKRNITYGKNSRS